MPMVNPDGVDLVTGSLSTTSYFYKSVLNISKDFPNITFPSGWKANINGVSFKNFQLLFYYFDELILSSLSNPSFE